MKIKTWRFELKLAHRWTIASHTGAGGGGGTDSYRVVFVELTDGDLSGVGEAAPSSRYQENADSSYAFLERVEPARLSFSDLPGSMQYLNSIADGHWAAKGALNLALLDGAAKAARQPLYDYLGLGFTEGRHLTSFSIGIDTPDVIRQKVQEAEAYPILKLKVGVARDRENLAALRAVAPKKIVRVDANEAWKTKEDALRQLELLAQDPNIELVEQPMPADTPESDLAWLKERTPLPLMADEAYRSADDLKRCAGLYHAVNVKLVKTGGLTAGLAALRAARQAGMKTMLGCMIESSVLISAAAHLAELTDYLDIDGNLLIRNDPYTGVSGRNGRISFEPARARLGLCVQPR